MLLKDIRDKLAMADILQERSKLEEAYRLYDEAVKMVKSAMKEIKLDELQGLLQHAILHGGSVLYHIDVPNDVLRRKVKTPGFQVLVT